MRRYSIYSLIALMFFWCSGAIATTDTQPPTLTPKTPISSPMKTLDPLVFQAADNVDPAPQLVTAKLQDGSGNPVAGLSANWGLRCPSGYTALAGGMCQKILTEIAGEQCPSGYSIVKDTSGNDVCQKISYMTADPACATGYSLSTDKTICSKTETVAPTQVCDSGWTLSGGECQRTLTVAANKSTSPATACPGGSVSGGQYIKLCNYSVGVKPAPSDTFTPTHKYSCPSGKILENGQCETTTSLSCSKYQLATLSAGFLGSTIQACAAQYPDSTPCPGDIPSSQYITYTPNKMCYSNSGNYITCPSGYHKTTDPGTIYGTTYICASNSGTAPIDGGMYCKGSALFESAVYSGGQCWLTQGYFDAECPTNYKPTQTLSSTNYSQQDICQLDTSLASPCPDGYSYSSTSGQCSKDETVPAQNVCSNGYTLSGQVCSQTVTQQPSNQCPQSTPGDTWSLSGSTCKETLQQIVSRVCPQGYTDIGSNVCQQIETVQRTQGNTLTVDLPKVWPGSYTLDLSIEDSSGNVDSQSYNLNYAPYDAISLRQGGKSLSVPAIQHAFSWNDGAATLVTSPINVNGTIISGQRPVFVGVKAGAPSGFSVSGVSVAPGQYKEITPSYDFTKTNGVLQLPLFPLQSGASQSDLIVSVGGDGGTASVIGVRAWDFVASVHFSTPNPLQIFDNIAATLQLDPSTPCSLTSSEVISKTDSVLNKPQCFVKWMNVPVPMKPSTSSEPEVSGAIDESGSQSVGYDAYVFDADKSKYLIGSGQGAVKVQSAMGKLHFKFSEDLSQVYQSVQNIVGDLVQDSGPACGLTADESAAIAAGRNGTRLCYVQWIDLPGSLGQSKWYSKPRVEGRVFSKGDYSLHYHVYVYNSIGLPVLVADETQPMTAIDPPAPQITFQGGTLISPGLYEDYLGGGRVVSAVVESQNAQLSITQQANGKQVSTDTIFPSVWQSTIQTYKRIDSVATKLWEVDHHSITADYSDLPDISKTVQVDTLAVPSQSIQPIPSIGTNYALNTDTVPVDVKIRNVYQPDKPYDSSTMGDWEVRLVEQKGYDQTSPISDWQGIDSQGNVTEQVDLSKLGITSGYLRIVAQARVKSPVPEYSRTVTSIQPVMLSVLYGGALNATLGARAVSGAIPFQGVFSVNLNDYGFMSALGDVKWMMSSDGNSWSEATNPSRNKSIFVHTFDNPGVYYVKATLTNRNSQAVSTTQPLKVIAYRKPLVTVDHPESVFVGDSVTLHAHVTLDGSPVDASKVNIQWSMDNGKTWASGGLDEPITRPGDSSKSGFVTYEVRVKTPIAPADDPYAWSVSQGTVTYHDVRPPRLFILGPRVLEVGKPYNFSIYRGLPYPRMAYNLEGYFTLPDGTQVSGTTVTYTPTDADLANEYVKISYTGWIDGWKDKGGKDTRSQSLRIWKYHWPKFGFSSRLTANVAPSELTVYVRPQELSGKLDNPQYKWDIPAGVTVEEDSNPIARKLKFATPGNYPIAVTITDARGHKAVVSQTYSIGTPSPYKLDFRVMGDNKYQRAPYTVIMKPEVTGGHPLDRITSYIYKVDGKVTQKMGNYGQAVLDAGKHQVTLDITSAFGKTAHAKKMIEAFANKPPVCKLVTETSTFRVSFKLDCTDDDGYVADYAWWINGKKLNIHGYTVSVNNDPNITKAETFDVKGEGIDDSGAPSAIQETTYTMYPPTPTGAGVTSAPTTTPTTSSPSP